MHRAHFIEQLPEQLAAEIDHDHHFVREILIADCVCQRSQPGERTDRPSSDLLEENRRLAKENAELRRANEILKAASAYFAAELDPTRRRS